MPRDITRTWFGPPLALALAGPCCAQAPAATPPPPPLDAALAQRLGADELGMRRYVLVVLKTGPQRMAAGPQRDEMFRGHFANIRRLADAGQLALAGPFNGQDGWRGLYIFAVATVEEARALTETDPVLVNGEMVAEYHPWYGSAALLMVPETHARIARRQP